MAESIAYEKSKNFSISVIQIYNYLCDTKREYVMSKQLLRSATSIGANLAESKYAVSKKDFLNKVYIALKEAAETKYWLEILYETHYLNKNDFDSLVIECIELIHILNAITKTIKSQFTSF